VTPQPAVQRAVRVEERRPAQPQPVRVVAQPASAPRAAPAAAPMRVAAAPAPQTEVVRRHNPMAAGFANRFSRRKELALVGIVGGSSGRHALIQTSSGRIEKVAPGDRIQGVQIAAIGSDSVRVSDGRRESVLAMPD
jgi:hypothetical protein